VVLFKPLRLAEIEQIVDIMLGEVKARLKERAIEIQISEPARKHIAEAGYDPVYGARPLKRYLQRELETRIGRLLIGDEVGDNSLISVDYDGKDLSLSWRALGAAEEAA